MEEALEDVITVKRLRWLGHLTRMKDDRIPKKLLFGWLPQRRPAHGTKLRWKDKVRKDLKKLMKKTVGSTLLKREGWRARCKEGLDVCTRERLEKDRERQMAATVAASAGQAAWDSICHCSLCVCDECHRSFRRRQDIARHKCQMTHYRGGIQ